MNIQKKVVLLLVVVVLIFASFVFLYSRSELGWFNAVFQNTVEQKAKLFDDIAALKGASVRAHITDYTFWDDMVNFVAVRDRQWAVKNVDPSLDAFKDNAVWIYDTDYSLVYSTNNIQAKDIERLPLSNRSIARVFATDKFCHFFMNTSKGLMEVMGATIHATGDSERKQPHSGYFFAGVLWDANYISDLPQILNGTVDFIAPTDKTLKKESAGLPFGAISFVKELKNWDDQPVMLASVKCGSEILRELYLSFRGQLIIFIIMSVMASAILFFFMFRWVNTPLKQISQSLAEENVKLIGKLNNESSEYGHIARLVKRFFEQKTELEKEIKERKRIEEQLQKWSVELEEKVKERTEELRKSQESLMRSEKLALMGRLASTVSHELRTPLTIIKNSAQFLKKLGIEAQKPESTEYLVLINKEVEIAAQVINNMLDFVRPKETVRKEVRLEDVLKESLSRAALPQGINVVTNYGKDIPALSADPVQIRQVFDNVIKNAIDAMQGKGTFTITTSRQDKYATVKFEDTGIGIAPENLPKIFEALFSTKPHGTGLGLSVCQQIVEAHKGTINVESMVGKGTIIQIRLPLG